MKTLKKKDRTVKKEVVKERSSKKSAFREYGEAILIALVLALFIRAFVIQAFKIPSGSMIPTLDIGDHILVNKFSYGLNIFRESYFVFEFPFRDINIVSYKKPKRGDIVVFKFPDNEKQDFIKRVVGTGGDVVEIKDKVVYVNGTPVNEPYVIHKDPDILPRVNALGERNPRDNFGPIRVPENNIFVMGDNRDQSNDSRFWHFVNIKKVKGKALIIYWSWDGDDSWVRWKRIGKLIH